jgi:hypothetical protein
MDYSPHPAAGASGAGYAVRDRSRRTQPRFRGNDGGYQDAARKITAARPSASSRS